MDPGTDLEVLSPVIAKKFCLKYKATDDLQEMIRCVQAGGCAIANVGGDRDDGRYTGVFLTEAILSPLSAPMKRNFASWILL